MKNYWVSTVEPHKTTDAKTGATNIGDESAIQLYGSEGWKNPFARVDELSKKKRSKFRRSHVRIYYAARESMRLVMKDLGVPERRVSLKRLHIISKEMYAEYIRSIKNEVACACNGHMFVQNIHARGQVDFAASITHELSHLVSHVVVEAHVGQPAICRPSEKRWRRVKQIGLILYVRDTEHPYKIEGERTGVGEAATEIVARRARDKLAVQRNSGVCLPDLTDVRSYEIQVQAIQGVIAEAAEVHGYTYASVEDILCLDHFLGTTGFYTLIQDYDPKLLELVLAMDREHESAAEVLYYLEGRTLSVSTMHQNMRKSGVELSRVA